MRQTCVFCIFWVMLLLLTPAAFARSNHCAPFLEPVINFTLEKSNNVLDDVINKKAISRQNPDLNDLLALKLDDINTLVFDASREIIRLSVDHSPTKSQLKAIKVRTLGIIFRTLSLKLFRLKTS